MTGQSRNLRWLRHSLVFVWLVTALVSVWERDGQSLALLRAAGLRDAAWMVGLIWAGAATDVVLGLALWFTPGRLVYLLALTSMLLMTLLATVLDPNLWLHPLGPLTKNIPMAAILVILSRRSA